MLFAQRHLNPNLPFSKEMKLFKTSFYLTELVFLLTLIKCSLEEYFKDGQSNYFLLSPIFHFILFHIPPSS